MSNAALISQRTAGLPGNPFAEADARVAAAIAAGEDVIDLSKGNPDGQPPAFVQDALAHAAHDPSLFRYPSFDGLPEYLNAIAGWYESKHGVSVDPATQLLATSGSSVGIATVIQALIDPGETVVAVNPYYPQYEGSTAVAGGRFETIPADPARGFLPDLGAVDPAVWERAKLLILNYPNNPTGAAAAPELYETAVCLAQQYGFIVLNDFAYAGLEFGSTRSLSLLETPGALDVALELGSLSKMYMVAGWRGGFVAGKKCWLRSRPCTGRPRYWRPASSSRPVQWHWNPIRALWRRSPCNTSIASKWCETVLPKPACRYLKRKVDCSHGPKYLSGGAARACTMAQ